MTAHPIRIHITHEGMTCAVCEQPVRWERPEYSTHVGHWVHEAIDPVALAASMARHPSGQDKPR